MNKRGQDMKKFFEYIIAISFLLFLIQVFAPLIINSYCQNEKTEINNLNEDLKNCINQTINLTDSLEECKPQIINVTPECLNVIQGGISVSIFYIIQYSILIVFNIIISISLILSLFLKFNLFEIKITFFDWGDKIDEFIRWNKTWWLLIRLTILFITIFSLILLLIHYISFFV